MLPWQEVAHFQSRILPGKEPDHGSPFQNRCTFCCVVTFFFILSSEKLGFEVVYVFKLQLRVPTIYRLHKEFRKKFFLFSLRK